jgi:hypothetical protein
MYNKTKYNLKDTRTICKAATQFEVDATRLQLPSFL